MTGSSIGQLFKVTTWGESHGEALGCVIEGVPPNLKIDDDYIQSFLDRRKPGQSKFTTQRKEDDKVKILSGLFNKNKSASTIATIASPTGTALIPTHGSCLPLVLIIVFLLTRFTVFLSFRIDLVGFSANLTTMS